LTGIYRIPSFGNGQFQYAIGIFIDGLDAYVGDYTNANIQKFNLNNGCSKGPGPLVISCPITVPTTPPTDYRTKKELEITEMLAGVLAVL